MTLLNQGAALLKNKLFCILSYCLYIYIYTVQNIIRQTVSPPMLYSTVLWNNFYILLQCAGKALPQVCEGWGREDCGSYRQGIFAVRVVECGCCIKPGTDGAIHRHPGEP